MNTMERKRKGRKGNVEQMGNNRWKIRYGEWEGRGYVQSWPLLGI